MSEPRANRALEAPKAMLRLVVFGVCLIMIFESARRTYTPAEMDQILQVYGVTLGDVSKAPPTYATTVDGKTAFGTAPIAWGPQVINSILVAYVVK